MVEKPLIIKDSVLGNKIAKGSIFCWTAILAADGTYKESEFKAMIGLAERNDYIHHFFDKAAIKKHFNDAVEIIKTYGHDELCNRIKFIFNDIEKTIRGHTFYTCLHLACADHELANREILILQKVYHALAIDVDSVFRLTLLFFQNEFSPKGQESASQEQPHDTVQEVVETG